MNCTVVSADGRRDFQNVESLVLPTLSGEVQVLPGHAESFLTLGTGQIVSSNKNEIISIEGGACHIKDDDVIVIL